jgi:hypothetical protein
VEEFGKTSGFSKRGEARMIFENSDGVLQICGEGTRGSNLDANKSGWGKTAIGFLFRAKRFSLPVVEFFTF